MISLGILVVVSAEVSVVVAVLVVAGVEEVGVVLVEVTETDVLVLKEGIVELSLKLVVNSAGDVEVGFDDVIAVLDVKNGVVSLVTVVLVAIGIVLVPDVGNS